VLERYPSNAKLLKAYAKFVEEVQHDPWRANRYYRWTLGATVCHFSWQFFWDASMLV
jgi:hypothetical protein